MANIFDSTNWAEYPPNPFIAGDYFVFKKTGADKLVSEYILCDIQSISITVSSTAIDTFKYN